MSVFDLFQMDEKLEKEGVILDYTEFTITIARAGGSNKKFGKVLNVKMEPYRRQQENGTLPDGVAERVMAETYAETVVLGWKGIKDAEGKEIEFTKENVAKLFLALPDFFRDIQEQANKLSLFRKKMKEEDAKN